jgi:hypothetical protein
MLYVALSCLQGRPMAQALDALRGLADGVQLTPGNHPTPAFAARTEGLPVRTHHGFSFTARSVPVWGQDLTCLVQSRSVHPPSAGEASFEVFAQATERQPGLPVLETMYPGHRLGTGAELVWAMDRALRLAVDVSHLQIQREAGALPPEVWRRLADYEQIDEIHVSGTDGRHDLHAPVTEGTFALAWVRERLRAGSCVVLECYMHRLSEPERARQVALVRGA